MKVAASFWWIGVFVEASHAGVTVILTEVRSNSGLIVMSAGRGTALLRWSRPSYQRQLLIRWIGVFVVAVSCWYELAPCWYRGSNSTLKAF
jgi:hypothetical protein